MMLVEKSFDTGEVVLNYAEGPDNGPPLVLLHGWTDRWQDFLPIIPTLSMRWRICALDFRGHGKSGRVQGKYRPEDCVEDVAVFLQNMVAEPAVLFGHSAGGVAALMLGDQIPEKVRAIIVGDSPIDLDSHIAQMNKEEMKRYWANLRDLLGKPMEELMSALTERDYDVSRLRYSAKTLSQVEPEVLDFHAEGRTREFFRNVNMDAVLRRISCPVLLLQGDPSNGGMLSDHDVEYARSVNSEISNIVIPDEGHSLGLYTWNVAPLLRAVMNFLESLR
jgi:pimeloyl-ACP methyl ester carboxylesterase